MSPLAIVLLLALVALVLAAVWPAADKRSALIIAACFMALVFVVIVLGIR